jgi:hypothetical protein
MVRIAAQAIFAVMQHVHSVRNFPIGKHPRDTMCLPIGATETEPPVAGGAGAGLPLKASALRWRRRQLFEE